MTGEIFIKRAASELYFFSTYYYDDQTKRKETGMGEMRNAYKILVGKPGQKSKRT
jgi:hypothetical protein